MKNYGLQSSAVTDLSNILKRFEVIRAFEGPQLLLAWEFFDDSDIDEFKIIKKEGAYPLSITDGIPVFSGSSSGSYGDLDVNGGTIYYYIRERSITPSERVRNHGTANWNNRVPVRLL